jgi:ABC-type phosphate transport system substrate-binding protein
MVVSAILFASCIPQLSNAQDTISIANPEVPVAELEVDLAIQVYTGKMASWPNGQAVTIVVLPREHPTSRTFIFEKLGISPYQFYESLDISINIRKNNSVVKVPSESEVVRIVANKTGSIGYTKDYMYYNYKDGLKKIRIY